MAMMAMNETRGWEAEEECARACEFSVFSIKEDFEKMTQ